MKYQEYSQCPRCEAQWINKVSNTLICKCNLWMSFDAATASLILRDKNKLYKIVWLNLFQVVHIYEDTSFIIELPLLDYKVTLDSLKKYILFS